MGTLLMAGMGNHPDDLQPAESWSLVRSGSHPSPTPQRGWTIHRVVTAEDASFYGSQHSEYVETISIAGGLKDASLIQRHPKQNRNPTQDLTEQLLRLIIETASIMTNRFIASHLPDLFLLLARAFALQILHNAKGVDYSPIAHVNFRFSSHGRGVCLAFDRRIEKRL